MIELRNIRIKLGNFIMKDTGFKINAGEYFVILGPTGCGKTVLLECLVGIRKPDSGEIWIDGQNVTNRYPEERHIGYLPQDFALFPTMTVQENMAFGLKARKKNKNHIRSVVEELSCSLRISGLLSRTIQGLSGGEKQRVALARALATEPKVVFLDEPLSALDEDTREKLASELRNIHDRFKTTFVHVSHNFEEVTQVADRVALMNIGSIEQIGTVDEIMKRPCSRYAAEFTRNKNIFEGVSESLANESSRVVIGKGVVLHSRANHSGNAQVTIRPEAIHISEKPFTAPDNTFEGRIDKTYNKGIFSKIDVDIGITISVYTTNRSFERSIQKNNDIVYLYIPPDSVNIIKC